MDRIRTKKPRIAVIGDLMIDHYIWGACERISPEAPVQVVSVTKESQLLGGAGNVVNNLLSLEADVGVFSVVGDDATAREMRGLLEKLPLRELNLIAEEGRKTTKKSRIVASNQQVVRYDDESRDLISLGVQHQLIEALKRGVFHYDMILLSDYGKGVLTPNLTQDIIALAKAFNKPILVDPKGKEYHKYRGATLLTPNKKEAMLATGMEIDTPEQLTKAITYLKEEFDLTYSIITLSEDGIALLDQDVELIPTVAREVFDVTGAGDTVLSALGVALASGFGIREACEFANKAAAVVVAKVGLATVTLNEIEEYTHLLSRGDSESKIKDFDEVERIAQRLRAEGRRVVFTNGCFDILHRGHASYLQKAKALGDVLIVGLNDDDSIRRLKGEDRPINPLEDRAFLLAALESVDFVVPFSEDTPYDLVKRVEPDILVKGADYKDKEVVGSDIAKEVVLIEFVQGRSTTSIIQKIAKGGGLCEGG